MKMFVLIGLLGAFFANPVLADDSTKLGQKTSVASSEKACGSTEVAQNGKFTVTLCPETLGKAYQAAIEEYSTHHKDGFFACNKAAASISKAGADTLLDDSKSMLISKKQRAAILNDYGFWLSCGRPEDVGYATQVLNKVIKIDPERAIAYLNLGDVTKAGISKALNEADKASLWQKAKSYYARYLELGGKATGQITDLESLNIPDVLHHTSNVCEYIASAANKELIAEITSPKGTATVNGTVIHFVVGYTSNSGEVGFKEEGRDGASDDPGDKIQLLQLAGVPTYGEFEVGPIYIIPFKGTYYTYSPIGNVVDPIKGPVCSVKRVKTELKLVENSNTSLCEPYLAGKLKHNVKWTPIDQSAIQPADVGLEPQPAFFDRETNISFLTSEKKRRVGHFQMSYGGHMGCEHYGVALLDKDSMKTGEPNNSLLEDQHKWWSCKSSDADIIKTDGKAYVDAWSGDEDYPQRVLLQLVNNKFEALCRIKPSITYKADVVQN